MYCSPWIINKQGGKGDFPVTTYDIAMYVESKYG